MKHLLFYDESCSFCLCTVAHIKRLDTKQLFFFEPLSSKKLDLVLGQDANKYRKMNTLVIVENYEFANRRIWIRGKGALRLFWLLGGKWKLLGILCFLPIGADLVYKIIARHRHRF